MPTTQYTEVSFCDTPPVRHVGFHSIENNIEWKKEAYKELTVIWMASGGLMVYFNPLTDKSIKSKSA